MQACVDNDQPVAELVGRTILALEDLEDAVRGCCTTLAAACGMDRPVAAALFGHADLEYLGAALEDLAIQHFSEEADLRVVDDLRDSVESLRRSWDRLAGQRVRDARPASYAAIRDTAGELLASFRTLEGCFAEGRPVAATFVPAPAEPPPLAKPVLRLVT